MNSFELRLLAEVISSAFTEADSTPILDLVHEAHSTYRNQPIDIGRCIKWLETNNIHTCAQAFDWLIDMVETHAAK